MVYNLGNLRWRLVLPRKISAWPLTSMQQRMLKTGGRLIKLLLVIAGRRTSTPASIRGHAATDCDAADTIGLEILSRLQNLQPKEEGRQGLQEIDYAATSGRFRRAKNQPSAPRSLVRELLW